MDQTQIDLMVDRLENLPTLPGVALKIIEAVKDENTNLDELGRILSMDPPLSGKILSLINSAFYALPAKVSSVSHGVKLLGVNAVKKVALGFSLLRLVKTNTAKGVQLRRILEGFCNDRHCVPSAGQESDIIHGRRRIHIGAAS